MKQYLQNKISTLQNEVDKIKVSEMKLSERIAYEKIKLHIKDLQDLIWRFYPNA